MKVKDLIHLLSRDDLQELDVAITCNSDEPRTLDGCATYDIIEGGISLSLDFVTLSGNQVNITIGKERKVNKKLVKKRHNLSLRKQTPQIII